jgi:rare lipoprotein A
LPVLLALTLCVALLSGCSGRTSFWSSSKPHYSKRVVEYGQPVPKGGGRYKVGLPYTIKGKTYTPKEVSHYDQVGVASWYGKDFHGRYTANREIYDMEALTAAHTTLPLPSYVRVTNLGNGRSLVLRVNDRGPYAHNRLIDLSWAAASLLQIERAGTGRVRVQYLGPAPLDGNDHLERRYLAQQPWAGPRVAQAASPAKALRNQTSSRWRLSSRKTKVSATTAVAQNTNTKAQIATAWPAKRSKLTARLNSEPEAPSKISHTPKPVKVASAKPHTPPMPAKRPSAPNPASAPARDVAVASVAPQPTQDATHPAIAPASAPPAAQTEALTPVSLPSLTQADAPQSSTKRYYVEAGTFAERATADKLAAILTEIAPTSIELTTKGTRIVHRLRLGPFDENADTASLIARFHNAGLREARLLTTGGI